MISKKYNGISDSEEDSKRPPKLNTIFETDIEKKNFMKANQKSKRPDRSEKTPTYQGDSEQNDKLELTDGQWVEIAYTAEGYDLKALTNSLKTDPSPGMTLIKKTQMFLLIEYKIDVQIIIFQFGTFAIWNSDIQLMDYIKTLMLPYEISPFDVHKIEADDMRYVVKPNNSKLSCHQHRFILQNDSIELKVTIAYAWGQAIT